MRKSIVALVLALLAVPSAFAGAPDERPDLAPSQSVPPAWVPFSAQFTITMSMEGRKETGVGRYYRSRDGSTRSEMPPPPQLRQATGNLKVFLIQINNAVDRASYSRNFKGEWYKVMIPDGMYRATFDPAIRPSPGTIERDGSREGLTLYRQIQNGSPSAAWLAEELNFFCVRSVAGEVETTYHDFVRADPPSGLFRPPPDAKVELLRDINELTRKLSGGN